MSKKLFRITLIFIMIILPLKSTCAQEIFYRNNLGVEFSKQEYDFITNMYWEGYQEYITLDDYTEIKQMNLFDKPIEKITTNIYNSSSSRSASVTANLRTLTIAKSCSDNCLISLVNKWNGNPTVKSYDVFGIRVSGVSILNINNALVIGKNYVKSYSNPKTFSNGFGYSILMPNVENVKDSITFTTTKGGTIYGSYQHAMSNTTEAVSKQYTIGAGGYGRVFNFTGNATSIYENSLGVDIQV